VNRVMDENVVNRARHLIDTLLMWCGECGEDFLFWFNCAQFVFMNELLKFYLFYCPIMRTVIIWNQPHPSLDLETKILSEGQHVLNRISFHKITNMISCIVQLFVYCCYYYKSKNLTTLIADQWLHTHWWSEVCEDLNTYKKNNKNCCKSHRQC
jgi:hypothetical protein